MYYFIMLRQLIPTVIHHLSVVPQNQPLITYGRPKGDGEVRLVSSIDKRKQDRLFHLKRKKKWIK